MVYSMLEHTCLLDLDVGMHMARMALNRTRCPDGISPTKNPFADSRRMSAHGARQLCLDTVPSQHDLP